MEHYTLPEGSNHHFFKKYIRQEIEGKKLRLPQIKYLCLELDGKVMKTKAGFITSDGYTYKAPCSCGQDGIIRIPLRELKQSATALLPHAYPTFLTEYFEPVTDIPFQIEKIETLEVSNDGEEIRIKKAWLE